MKTRVAAESLFLVFVDIESWSKNYNFSLSIFLVMSYNKFCQVKNCFNSSIRNPDLLWFWFPRTADIRQEWAYRCGSPRDSYHPKSHLICSTHFSDSVIDKGKLLKRAVPTLSLPVTIDDPDPIWYNRKGADESAVSHNSCAVVSCCNTLEEQSGLDWFAFPTDEETKSKWIKLCGLQNMARKNMMVCSVHFRSEDLELEDDRLKLQEDAFPSLHLELPCSSADEDENEIDESSKSDTILCPPTDLTEECQDLYQSNVENSTSDGHNYILREEKSGKRKFRNHSDVAAVPGG